MTVVVELRIADSVVGSTAPAAGIEVRRLNGRVIRRFNKQLGGHAVVTMRRDLHEALLKAVGRDALKLRSEAIAVSPEEAGVTLRLKDGTVQMMWRFVSKCFSDTS